MGIEIDLVFVWVDEIDLMSAWEIKIDLISVKGSKLTWFLCGGRKFLGLRTWIEINWFGCRGIKIDLNLEWGSKLTSL